MDECGTHTLKGYYIRGLSGLRLEAFRGSGNLCTFTRSAKLKLAR